MANVIGNLRAILSLNTKSFIAGLTTAGRATKAFRGSMFDMGRGLQRFGGFMAGFVAPGAALYTMIDQFRELGDMADLSERLNIGNKALQGFRLAAMDAGISADDTTTALQFMLKTVGEATEGSKEAMKAVEGLGLSIDGLAQQSSDEILYRIADALQKIKDPAVRAAREVDIFGRAGAKLDAALKGGRGNLKGFETEMQKMGRVFDKESLDKVDAAGDAFNRLKESLKGLMDVSIVGFGPALEAVFKGLTSVVSEAGAMFGGKRSTDKTSSDVDVTLDPNVQPHIKSKIPEWEREQNERRRKTRELDERSRQLKRARLLGDRNKGIGLDAADQQFLIDTDPKPKAKDGQSLGRPKVLDEMLLALGRIEQKLGFSA